MKWPFSFGARAAAPPDPVPVTKPTSRRRPSTSKRALGAAFIDAGETDRFTTGWSTQPVSADWIVERFLLSLVARSRQQVAGNGYARKYIKLCTNNISGPDGIRLQAKVRTRKGVLDQQANAALETAFQAWGDRRNCDIRGRLSWRGIQTACVESAAKDGEFFVRMVWGADAGPWGFALQVIDPMRCPVNMKRSGLPGGGFIRQGIEFNAYGRAVAYYFSTMDNATDNYQYNGQDYLRVPAEEIIHGFVEEMANQRRGLPWLSSVLYRLRQLDGMETAALINARASAGKMAFAKYADGYAPDADEPEEILVDGGPGEIPILPEGVDIASWDPQYPNGEFASFTKQMLQGAASGLGVSYPSLASDLEGVNFSSIRQGVLEERERWKELQEWFTENLLTPVYEAWLRRALLTGRVVNKNGRPLPAERLASYLSVKWQARRWSWVDPRADADAQQSSKNNLLTSASRIIREAGGDPEAIYRETAADVRQQIEALVAEGISRETAEKLVMQSMGMDKHLLTGKDNGETDGDPATTAKTE